MPALNEGRTLGVVVRQIRAAAPCCDVCVVDDGSVDDTAAVGARLGVTVLRCPLNLGIGGAVQAGYLWAVERGYDAAVQIDGDGQHDPTFVQDALAPIVAGRANLVVGSRFLGSDGFRSTPLRRLGIRYLSWFLRVRCGARVTDATSGFRAADRSAMALFARAYPSDYPEPESIALAVRAGLAVAEIPVRMRERGHGASSIGFAAALYYFVKVSIALLLLPARRAPELELPRGR